MARPGVSRSPGTLGAWARADSARHRAEAPDRKRGCMICCESCTKSLGHFYNNSQTGTASRTPILGQ
jgi:hypothetical protein